MATIEDFKKNELFKDFTDSNLKEVLLFCKEKTFNPRSHLYNYGERGKEFFVLLEGDVELQISTDHNYGLAMVHVKQGDAFGFSALLDPYIYTSTATCLTKVKVIAIEVDPFLSFVSNQNIQLGFLIMRNMAHLFLQRNEFIEQLYEM